MTKYYDKDYDKDQCPVPPKTKAIKLSFYLTRLFDVVPLSVWKLASHANLQHTISKIMMARL